MPAFRWLSDSLIDAELTTLKLQRLEILGVPYSDEDIANAADVVANKTKMDALIAYLQGLGSELR